MRVLAALGLIGFTVAFTTVLPDRPPLGHTGGFGEPTCTACHSGAPVNQPGGSLKLTGVPWVYEPNGVYRITVRLARADIANGGFELSARIAGGARPGSQAGSFRALDERVDVADSVRAGVGAISYARHTRAGIQRAATDTLQWTLEWKAPGGPAGSIIFNAAGNAGNDDNSPLGDYIYTTAATSRGERLQEIRQRMH